MVGTPYVPSQRWPIDPRIDRLSKTVAADFDQDGWFEICGWYDHALYAIDPVDKTLLWRVLDGSSHDGDLFVGPGRVYVSTHSELIALDASTAQRLWSIPLTDVRELHDPGVFSNGVIWVGTGDQLVAADRLTGAHRWSWPLNDSVSLFRTLVGQHLVFNDADGLRILMPAQKAPIIGIVANADRMLANVYQAMEDLAAGKLTDAPKIPDTVKAAVVHRGVVYVAVERDEASDALDAYRVADGRHLARHAGQSLEGLDLVGAIGGHPISRRDEWLRREPDGPVWSAGAGVEYPFVTGTGPVLVVVVNRNGAYDLVGLDGTTLTVRWHLDNVPCFGEVIYADDLLVMSIQSGGTMQLVGIDPASGGRRWETVVTGQARVSAGGGLVIEDNGATFFAGSGQMIFPVDQRTTTPPLLAASAPDEVPDWGNQAAAHPSGRSRSAGLLALVAVLVVVAVGIAVAVLR